MYSLLPTPADKMACKQALKPEATEKEKKERREGTGGEGTRRNMKRVEKSSSLRKLCYLGEQK